MAENSELPVITFQKSTNLTKEDQERTVEEFKGLELLHKEQGLPEAWYEAARILAADESAWIKDTLGLDVSKRLATASKKIKFLTKVPDNAPKKLRDREDDYKIAGGYISTTGEPFIFTANEPHIIIHSLVHELMHAAARGVIFINKVEGTTGENIKAKEVKELLSGYHATDTDTFRLTDEVFTEMMSAEFISGDKNNRQLRLNPWSAFIGYEKAVIFFDMAIQKAAQKLGRQPTELRHNLYRGQIKGDASELRVFEEAFGKGTLKKIVNLDRYGTSDAFLGLARDFDINVEEYTQKVDDYYSHKHITILDNVPVRLEDL